MPNIAVGPSWLNDVILSMFTTSIASRTDGFLSVVLFLHASNMKISESDSMFVDLQAYLLWQSKKRRAGLMRNLNISLVGDVHGRLARRCGTNLAEVGRVPLTCYL